MRTGCRCSDLFRFVGADSRTSSCAYMRIAGNVVGVAFRAKNWRKGGGGGGSTGSAIERQAVARGRRSWEMATTLTSIWRRVFFWSVRWSPYYSGDEMTQNSPKAREIDEAQESQDGGEHSGPTALKGPLKGRRSARALGMAEVVCG